MDEYAYVYILASKLKRLYTGVTSQIDLRVWQHKNKIHPESFTAKYNIDQLVYFERFASITAAIAREKEIKGWLRVKKVALIVASNPDWRDLSSDWENLWSHSARRTYGLRTHSETRTKNTEVLRLRLRMTLMRFVSA